MIEKRSTLGSSQACARAAPARAAGRRRRAPRARPGDQRDAARCGRGSEISFINVSVRGWLGDCAFAMCTAASFRRADTFGGWPGPAALVVVDRSYSLLARRTSRGGARTVAAKRVHARPARHRVLVQAGARALGVAGGDEGEDPLVLMRRLAQPSRLGQRVAAEQAQLVDEPAVHLQQLRVAGELDQGVVEAQVGEVVALEVVADRRVLHPLDQRAQLGELLRADRERELAARHLVEGGADLVDLVGLVDRDLAHEHAAVLLDPHQAGLRERAQRLAHRPARDAEARRDGELVELLAGGELAGEDHPLELALHEHGQRMVLQDRDVRRGVAHRPMIGF